MLRICTYRVLGAPTGWEYDPARGYVIDGGVVPTAAGFDPNLPVRLVAGVLENCAADTDEDIVLIMVCAERGAWHMRSHNYTPHREVLVCVNDDAAYAVCAQLDAGGFVVIEGSDYYGSRQWLLRHREGGLEPVDFE